MGVDDCAEKLERLNSEKEAFFSKQFDIRRTVAPYALNMYTRALVEKLRTLTNG